MASPILLIGIGNEYRSDDAIGLVVLRALQSRNLPGVECRKSSGDGTTLMEAWQTANKVIVIDAVSSGAKPATLFRFDMLKQSLPLSFSFSSTHTFGIAEAIAMAEALHELPSSLILYAIEAKHLTLGNQLSSEVEKAGQAVVEQVTNEIRLMAS